MGNGATKSADLLAAGLTALQARQYAQAVSLLQEYVGLMPMDAAARHHLAFALHSSGKSQDAYTLVKSALQLDPGLGEAYVLAAQILRSVNDIGGAVAWLDRALGAGLGTPHVHALRFFWAQAICDWANFEKHMAALRDAARICDGSFDPPIAHAVPSLDPAAQADIAKAYARRLSHPAPLVQRRSVPESDRPLRIGYLSADLYDHPVGRLLVGLIRNHDRRKVAVYGYLAAATPRDEVQALLSGAFDVMRDPSTLSDPDAARLIAADAIDILIDTGGYTGQSRPGVVAFRPAPVQVLYLGQGGTSGGTLHDVFLADETVAPAGDEAYYTERLARLPVTLFNYDPAVDAPFPPGRRSDLGIPEDAFVFCSFNSAYKITPAMFDIWAGLLRDLPNAVLALRKYNKLTRDNLLKEAAARGIDPGRLIFFVAQSRTEYLSRLTVCDLALDTFPYAGASTAIDTLMARVPVVTCAGDTYVSRQAASVLKAVGLPDLIARDFQHYRDIALRLATEPGSLSAVRARLSAGMTGSVLFDSAAFARQFEAVLAGIWERHCCAGG